MCNHEWALLGWDYSWTPQGKKLEKNKVGRMRVLLNRWRVDTGICVILQIPGCLHSKYAPRDDLVFFPQISVNWF